MRRRLLLVLVAAVLLSGCAGPDAAHYKAILDRLAIPATWELVHTTVKGPGGDVDCVPQVAAECPSVARYYLVDGKPIDAYPSAKQILIDAGFTIDRELSPTCDIPPSFAACSLDGVKDGDLVRVSLYNPGDDPENLGVAAQGRTLIQLLAYRKI